MGWLVVGVVGISCCYAIGGVVVPGPEIILACSAVIHFAGIEQRSNGRGGAKAVGVVKLVNGESYLK